MKRFILTFSVLFFSLSMFALDSNYFSFKITPEFSFANGTINEYVFDAACKNTDNKESQLDWDIKMIPILSLDADFDIIKYLHIDFNGAIGLSKESGNMQDYDWLNSMTGIWKNDDPTELTNYSIHDNYLEQYITFSVSAGGNIYLPLEIKLTPKIGYQYEFISLNGSNGSGKYKQQNGWKQVDFKGNVIAYKQELNALLAGFTVDVKSIPRTNITADIICSPAMTFLNAVDYHYTRNLIFWDKFTNLWQFKSNLIAQYRFNKYNSAGLSTSIQYIPLSKGPTYQKYLKADGSPYPGSWTPSNTNGGTQRFIWTFGINYSFSL